MELYANRCVSGLIRFAVAGTPIAIARPPETEEGQRQGKAMLPVLERGPRFLLNARLADSLSARLNRTYQGSIDQMFAQEPHLQFVGAQDVADD
jgi:hypothetical protein